VFEFCVQIYEEGKLKAEYMYQLPAMAPVRKGVEIGMSVAEVGMGVGKTAVGVANTALAPARFAVRVGSSAVKTGTHVSLTAAEKSVNAVRILLLCVCLCVSN
jgi:hypothetical protein